MDGTMKRVSMVVLLALLSAFTLAAEQDEVALLRWAGPEGTRPGTYEEWVSAHPSTPFSCALLSRKEGTGRSGAAAIFTDSSLVEAIGGKTARLISDLWAEGYTVFSYSVSGGTPEDLKAVLSDLYTTEGLEGALFVGDLPVAWFEVEDDFHSYGYADFPCDLFYMDLDGTWYDTLWTGNGKYDGHGGAMEPEIYVGHLIPRGIGVDTLLLQAYFDRDHEYRTGTLTLPERALVFCDDDWMGSAPYWAQNVALLYEDTLNYWDPETTKAAVYRVKLDTPQAWVSVFAHSWPDGHQFVYGGYTLYDYYYSWEYTSQVPPAFFYNHFACSFSRFTETGCGGARSMFTSGYGLGEIGSTKTGSVLDFHYFYDPLGQGSTLGEAFRDWFTFITGNGVTFTELCWHYGMTLLGDPFLKPTGHEPEWLCGDANGDGICSPGDAYLVLNFFGSGAQPVSCFSANVNGDAELTTGDGYYLLNWMGGGPELNCGPCEF
jgi:hypothetical protein